MSCGLPNVGLRWVARKRGPLTLERRRGFQKISVDKARLDCCDAEVRRRGHLVSAEVSKKRGPLSLRGRRGFTP